MTATRIFIQGSENRATTLFGNWPLTSQFGSNAMSKLKFQFLFANFWCPPELFPTISEIWESHWQYGEFAALDEKQMGFRGASPCIRKVLSKPSPIGHWISQVCVFGTRFGYPFCTKVWPFLGKGWNPSCLSLVEWASSGLLALPYSPIIAMDSYYLDSASRAYLLRTKQPYICSAN